MSINNTRFWSSVSVIVDNLRFAVAIVGGISADSQCGHTLTRFSSAMKDLFQLLFIHIGTRRIWISPATNNPDANWMSEQAKSFMEHCDDVELKHTIIMRDNEGKFQKGFDEVLEAGKCYVKKNTPASPNLNAFVERAVQTYEHKCQDQFIVISPRQLNVIGREFQTW